MPERAECGDVVIQNGALAALAAWGEQLQEVPPAVGAALPLVETWGQGQRMWAGLRDPSVAVGLGSREGRIGSKTRKGREGIGNSWGEGGPDRIEENSRGKNSEPVGFSVSSHPLLQRAPHS